MMCSARLINLFPARDGRWRFWSPEEASNGAAVPFQEANPVPVGEAVDVTDVSQQPCGAGGTDPGHRHQR